MLTKADDYPVHQTPDPVAISANRNLYDRYFFNGFSDDGACFFGVALGVYPHLNVMDGAFAVAVEGVQHNLRVSRHLGWERMDTQVGPLRVEVIEPLKRLRVLVAENEHDITADLVFTGRIPPLEEPRQRSIRGGRITLDITRMTQNGDWEGWILVHGRRIEVRPNTVRGTRDRSWGIRGIGVPRNIPQMFWLWAPLQSETHEFLFYAIEHADGSPMVKGAQIASLAGGEPEHMADAWADIAFRQGTREVERATLHFIRRRGQGEVILTLTPSRDHRLFLSGLGYGHQEWGHGFDKGPYAIAYDTLEPAGITVHAEPWLHQQWAQYQARTKAEIIMPGGEKLAAVGVLEQILLGDHMPSGLKGLVDPPQAA
jgi:hypothetical protein